jgi:hypothetical protein
MLRHDDFAVARGEIDELMNQRTPTNSGAGSDNCVQIAAQVDALKSVLAAKVKQYKPTDYLTARRFLENITLEAQNAADPPRTYSSVVGN